MSKTNNYSINKAVLVKLLIIHIYWAAIIQNFFLMNNSLMYRSKSAKHILKTIIDFHLHHSSNSNNHF